MKLKNLINEDIFRERHQMFWSEWDTFKKNFLKRNPNTKTVISKKDGTEYLIHKNDPKKAILKYDKEDGELYHDLKQRELFSYIK